MEILLFEHPTN